MYRAALFTALLAVGTAGAEELEDPMRPPQTRSPKAAAERAPSYWLSSTLIANDRRVAVLNGHRVGVGGRIGAARVVEILPTEVILRRYGKRITVRLLPEAVKTPVTSGAR